MTDPIKLAKEIKAVVETMCNRECCEALRARQVLILAALRLAEASMLSWYRGGGRVFIDVDESAFDAYRAAREGR